LSIPPNRALIAAAGPLFAAPPAAGAGIGGGYEHEIRGQATRVLSASDDDAAVFEDLAKGLSGASLELGQLVEKENAAVGQGNLAGDRGRPAAQESGQTGRVVGRSEGARAKRGLALGE
jgi:hypothetical protein